MECFDSTSIELLALVEEVHWVHFPVESGSSVLNIMSMPVMFNVFLSLDIMSMPVMFNVFLSALVAPSRAYTHLIPGAGLESSSM